MDCRTKQNETSLGAWISHSQLSKKKIQPFRALLPVQLQSKFKPIIICLIQHPSYGQLKSSLSSQLAYRMRYCQDSKKVSADRFLLRAKPSTFLAWYHPYPAIRCTMEFFFVTSQRTKTKRRRRPCIQSRHVIEHVKCWLQCTCGGSTHVHVCSCCDREWSNRGHWQPA